jgi:MFS family permease
LPFGRLVDRQNRRNIISIAVLLWSVMTVCCGLSRTYFELFIARLGVGFGEACLAPAAYSFITDLFPPRRHGRALALFTVSSVVGGGGSFIIGAKALAFATAAHWSLPGVGVLAPWRLTFVLIGAPGIVVALLLLTIKEPARHTVEGMGHQPTLRELIQFLRQIRKPLSALIVGNCAMSIAGTGVIGWMIVFLSRTYGALPVQTGHLLGTLLILSALVGGPIAGWTADSKFVARLKGEKLMMMAFGCAAALPFAIWFPLAPTMALSLSIFLCYSILYNVEACSAPAMLQDILPNRFKGQVTALYWLCVGIVGFGGGSTAIALVTDRVFADSSMLRYSLLSVAAPCLMVAFICALAGRSSYQVARNSLRAAQAEI